MFFGASIQWRVVYALAASLLWLALVELNEYGFGDTWTWPFYGTGAVYAALVLVPYLPNLRGLNLLRALALLVCGAFSYWSAVVLFPSLWTPAFVRNLGDSVWLTYSMAQSGLIGAAIIAIGARLFVPLRIHWIGWLMLLSAGWFGGVALGIAANAGASVSGSVTYQYWFPGHVAWQVLVCLALYFGSDRSAGRGST